MMTGILRGRKHTTRTARNSAHVLRRGWQLRAFTLVEVLVASAISILVVAGLMQLLISITRSQKATISQQLALYRAKQAVETINRRIRVSTVGSIVVKDSAGNVASQGNRVEFGTDTVPAAIELGGGTDNDVTTPWDNQLIYYPSAASTANAYTVVRAGIGTPDTGGAFKYNSGRPTLPLTVRMRTGDSLSTATSAANKAKQDDYSGRNMQGVDITITVGPRNGGS